VARPAVLRLTADELGNGLPDVQVVAEHHREEETSGGGFGVVKEKGPFVPGGADRVAGDEGAGRWYGVWTEIPLATPFRRPRCVPYRTIPSAGAGTILPRPSSVPASPVYQVITARSSVSVTMAEPNDVLSAAAIPDRDLPVNH
jgi:hypothetical protein